MRAKQHDTLPLRAHFCLAPPTMLYYYHLSYNLGDSVNTISITPKTQDTVKTSTLFGYFVPELITVTLLYIGLEIINFRFIACIDTPLCNSTLFITNSLFHFITKIGEGFSIGLVILCGRYNGTREYKKSGELLSNAFWITTLVGAVVFLMLYFGAHTIYQFFEAPPQMISLGVPYLRIRAIGIFLAFIYLALIGFLRGIKNPKLPMLFFILGAIPYIFIDYALIFGAWGFPAMGLQGSAIATVVQYAIMLLAALIYLLVHNDNHKYNISLLTKINPSHLYNLIALSWPIMIDKASFALGHMWLNKMIGCTAKLCSTTVSTTMYDGLTVLKTMENVGILPAVAFAQVITFLVSNDIKLKSFKYIKRNIKKVLLISCLLVGLLSLAFCLKPSFFLALLNKKNAYSQFIAYTLPFVTVLIMCDVFQLILSASLRGGSDVKTVMLTRLAAIFLFFIPLTYCINLLPIQNMLLKFMLLYSSSHLSYALMGSIYLLRLRSKRWTSIEVIPAVEDTEKQRKPIKEVQL